MTLKKLGTAIFAVVAIGAVFASSAFATATPTEVNWQKGVPPYESQVTKALAVTTEANSALTLAFELAGTRYVIQATGVECLGCKIEGGSGSGRLRFTGVRFEEPAGCGISSTLESSALTFSARYEEGNANLVKFVATAGENKEFMMLEITGCPLATNAALKGSMFGRLEIPTGVQAERQPIDFSPAINEAAGGRLTFGTKTVTLTGTTDLKAGGTPIGLAPGGLVLPEKPTQTAARWYTGTTAAGATELTGSQAVTAKGSGFELSASVAQTGYLVTASGSECVECQISNSPTGGTITGRLKFTGLAVHEPAGCTAPATLTSAPLTMAANWAQGERALVKFTPTAGETKELFTVPVEGCTFATDLVPKGNLFGMLEGGQGTLQTARRVLANSLVNGDAGGLIHVGTKVASLSIPSVQFSAGGLFFGVK